jgi:hypothetical protein
LKKKFIVIGIIGLTILVLTLAACSSNTTQVAKLTADNAALTKQNQALINLIAPPPASLDNFYPPKAQAPVWLIEMFNLAGPFEGIGVNLQENDMAGAKASFQAFQAQYTKMSTMVPEWTSRFPAAPVTALGQAINSGDPAKIGQAMGPVGQVCGDCHTLDQVKVEQKYHWKNFDDVKVTNPVTKQSMNWTDYMTAMGGAYEGALTDLQAGKVVNARQNFQAFQAEFTALAQDGCKQCHQDQTGKEIPRKYFVDSDSMALINQMGQALTANRPDAAAIGNLSGAIGNAICLNCHLVHLPAQNTKDLWTLYGQIVK